MTDALRRRRAAAIGGFARVAQADPDELAAARRKGGESRAAQTRGDSSWGRYLAACRAAKRAGGSTPTTAELMQRMAKLERAMAGNAKGARDTDASGEGERSGHSPRSG